MRLAYHISLHEKAYQFGWLFDAIYNSHDLFAVHVDTKARAETKDKLWKIVGTRPNVSITSSHSVIYSEWALCQIELEAIQHFVDYGNGWDFLINLSAQDYPLKNRDLIEDDLSKYVGRNFINIKELNQCPAYFRRRLRWLSFRVGDWQIRTPLPRRLPRNFDINWHGSMWHILSREFCEWVTRDEMTETISKFLKNAKMPNEFLMQMLIMNSPFKETLVPDYRRKIIWRHRHPHPEVLTMRDFEKVISSDALFARKFDAKVDEAILDAISRHAGLKRAAPDEWFSRKVSAGRPLRPARVGGGV